MEIQKLSTKKFAINNGLLLGLLGVLLGVIMYVMNMHLERSWITSIASFAINIGVIVYALKQFKQANAGFMTLGQALKLGLGVALVAGIITVIFNYILMNFIEPDMMSQIMEKQQEAMIESNPNMTQAQLDGAAEMGAKFSSPPIIAAFTLIGSLFFGFIISLIAGLIMKRENPNA